MRSIIAAALLAFGIDAFGAPSVSGVSGTVGDGNAITITGSSFGSGPTIQYFDNFEAGSNGQTVSTTATVGTYSNVFASGSYTPKYSTDSSRSGSKSVKIDFGGGSGDEYNNLGKLFGSSSAWLLSFWQRIPSGVNIPGTGGEGANYKQFWANGANYYPWASDYVDVLLNSSGSVSLLIPANDSANSGASACSYHNTLFSNNGVWVRKTWYLRHSESTSGVLWAQEMNGSSQIVPCNNTSAKTTHGGILTNAMSVPGYGRVESGSVVYLDDLYLATGANAWARVEICNSSTYSSATNCTLLTPSAWSSSSITATVRAGSLSGSAYLFVIDSDNAASSGYAISFGATTTYTVTPSAGANGSISPNTAQTVSSGNTAQFTVTPSGGYTATVGGTCGGSLVGTTYTTNAITADCTVSATFAGDTTPPVISSPLPTGEQAYGTSSVTLQVTTSEAATCKYHTSDVAYASMGSTFGSTGGTTHQQTGFSTANGQSYTRYVRCIDGYGNANTSSATISFSVSAVNETILDNAGAGASQSGSWSPSTYVAGYYGSNYHYAPEASGHWFQWTTSALAPGVYGVYAWWPAVAGRPTSAQYEITHSGGTATVSANQTASGGQWNLLGTYSFGSTGTVRLLSSASGPEGAAADAIRFVATTCKQLATPTGLAVTGQVANPPSNATITFDWADVTSHTDSSALTGDLYGYRLSWGTVSGGPYNTASTASGITSVAVGPAQANITYYARVAAESSISATCDSAQSSEISFFADTVPPVLSGMSPTGDQSTVVTSIALALTTDDAATCRYDLNGVSDYDSMTNYTSTGSTSHSATVNVLPGRVYVPAAKCRDAAGNTSASPVWRFAIPSTPKRRVRR